ncbi:DegT/DnrJ/EryC1/StrS family aminotransferase [Kiloniella laminariae]|uniref:DegT/DnrJ/EryC1/StrS family aminotransferase n=1 Tax=Kiloniella laminariae TaxID=454162 RepID=UPI000381FEFF|nr:DegT/DnrJ/EryC1/StrS family aminotransferase [Kiloniella laminariae]
MKIPLVNLERQHRHLRAELADAYGKVLDSGNFIQGDFVRRFETEFAKAQELPNAIGCANGTVALEIALRTLAVGPGDEVILPAHTFIATAEAVCAVGAIPVFADISIVSHTITAEEVLKVSTSRTKAIIPVHIYGFPCPMGELLDVAEEHKWFVIEDCAQAHGCSLLGHPVGSFGDAASFSFFPGKNLGALGDAGIVSFRSEENETYARCLINHGRSSKNIHRLVGGNFRMDELQAAFLSVKLPRLPKWNANRRARAKQYREALGSEGYSSPTSIPGADPVYHLFVVAVSNRDEVIMAMESAGINCGIHYSPSCHLQGAMSGYWRKALPNAEQISSQTISLPICGELSACDVDIVLSEFLKIAKPN